MFMTKDNIRDCQKKEVVNWYHMTRMTVLTFSFPQNHDWLVIWTPFQIHHLVITSLLLYAHVFFNISDNKALVCRIQKI